MKGKAIQSESGSITVMTQGDNLLIWVGGVGYLVDNPAFSDRAIEIEYNVKSAVGQIKSDIDKIMFQRNQSLRF